jgi:hypothetical protein
MEAGYLHTGYGELLSDVIAQLTPSLTPIRNKPTFAYLADESSPGRHAMPGTAHYDDFAQIEDGVGMVRKFLNDFETEIRRCRKPRPRLCGTLVTGTLFYPILSECMSRLNDRIGSRLRTIEAPNRFMGESITVAGLLAGQDILDACHRSIPAVS